jgi:hypothetical protein
MKKKIVMHSTNDAYHCISRERMFFYTEIESNKLEDNITT